MSRTRKITRTPLRAVAYLRVSTDRQDLGLDAQRAAIEAWAARGQIAVVSWHEDRVSGGADLDARPALADAVAALARSDAGLFVVAKRDRLARDTTNAGLIGRQVERLGAVVASADGVGDGVDPASQMLAGIMDVFAQFERALIRSRTVAALAVKKLRREKWNGVAPYGWALAGQQLVAAPAEQAAVRFATARRDEGASLRAVARELEAAGHKPRRGEHWHPQTVARMTRQDAWRL